MKTFDDVKFCVQKFETEYCPVVKHPISEPIIIKSLYEPEYKNWPLAKFPRVYCFYNENAELIYIGKASANRTLGMRLNEYFDRMEPRFNYNWDYVPYMVSCIAVKLAWQAPSLEEYLIGELRPLQNKAGNCD